MRKGQIRMGFLISLLIGIFVLVIVWYFIFGPGKEATIDFISILIPSFNQTKTPVEEIQIIRYDITTHTLERFDGVNYRPFRGVEQFEKKEVNPVSIVNKIKSQYLEAERPLFPQFNLRGRTRDIIYTNTEVYDCVSPSLDARIVSSTIQSRFDDFTKCDRGDVIVELAPRTQPVDEVITKSFGTICVHADNSLSVQKIISCNRDSTLLSRKLETLSLALDKDDILKQIIQETQNWRDSPLKNPIEIPYTLPVTEGLSGPPSFDSVKVCARKIDQYLVLDLSEPAGTTCPI